MHPILLRLWSHEIWSHAVLVGLGVAVAVVSAWRLARREHRADADFVWVIAGGLVGASIMAKFGLGIRYLLEPGAPSWTGFLNYGGRTLLGGLAGAYAGVVLTKRLIGYRRNTGDILAPGVALGIAIGRIGCFLAERPGTPTSLPWGVRVPAEWAGRLADCEGCLTGAAMHPSFLYESAFLGLLSWWLFRAARRDALPAPWMVEGDLFKLFLAAYALFRFAVEFVRGNPVMALGLSGSQLMVAPGFLLLLAYFARRRRLGTTSARRVAADAVAR